MLVIFNEDFGNKKKGQELNLHAHYLKALLDNGVVSPIGEPEKKAEPKVKSKGRPKKVK
jgi:hypothetical protein